MIVHKFASAGNVSVNMYVQVGNMGCSCTCEKDKTLAQGQQHNSEKVNFAERRHDSEKINFAE